MITKAQIPPVGHSMEHQLGITEWAIQCDTWNTLLTVSKYVQTFQLSFLCFEGRY